MDSVATTQLLSGFDLRSVDLPEGSSLLSPASPVPGLPDFARSVKEAFDAPVSGLPLAERLPAGARICIVLDDFSLPVPPATVDVRRELLAFTRDRLQACGVDPARIRVLVANGLNRQWRPNELTDLLGPTGAGAPSINCHDAEDSAQLRRIGELPQGPIELNRALFDCDLVLYLNVVSTPLHAGLFGLVSGTAGYRTARWLGAPALFEEDAPFVRGSAYHRLHEEVGAALLRQVPVFQLSAVLNNELWPPRVAAVVRTGAGSARSAQLWNAMPNAVQQRAARLMRSSYRPFAVLGGNPTEVAARALPLFLRQHQVQAGPPADIVVFGLPDVGPFSVGSSQNPILAAHLALGSLANLFTERALLRKGGVLIFANPLSLSFDRTVHGAHEEFYDKVLRVERQPAAIHEQFEGYFGGRPEFVSNYQRRFAFHGTHPLYCWYQCAPARRQAVKIIAAHADPRTCARLGLMPAADVEQALNKAREILGLHEPSIAVLDLLPPFFVQVNG